MNAKRLRTVLLALPLLVALSACGSTVEISSTGAAQDDGLGGPGTGVQTGADGLGGSAGSFTGAGTTTGGSGTTGAGGTGTTSGAGTGAGTSGGTAVGTTGSGPAAPGTTGGAAGTTGTTAPTTSTGGPGKTTGTAAVVNVPKTGRGWDEKSVYIGVTTQKDAEAAFSSVGFKGVSPGDTEKQAQAVADSINAKGGVFGRQVKLVFRDHATIGTALDPTATGSATCAFFTQDKPVIAVINIVTLLDGPNFRTCLAKGKVTLFSATVIAVDDAVTKALSPYFLQTVGVSWNSLAPAMVRSLKAQGYFTGWDVRNGKPGSAPVRVGIIASGDDVGTRVAAVTKKAFTDAGYSTLVYQYADKTQGQGSSVLAFAGKGVTHVIVTDVEMLAFMTSADGQGYKPRYGVSSYNAPVTNLETFAPAGQLNGALGVGWAPGLDVNDANDPGATTTGGKTCAGLQSRAGQTFTGQRLALVLSQSLCDALFLTADAAKAGGGFTGPQLYDGILRTGPAFSSAVGFSTGLTAAKPFVPGSLRGTTWFPACTCWKYTSGQTAF